MTYSHSVGGTTWRFDDLRELMAKARPARSGALLAGVAAGSDAERVAAQMSLADVPLRRFLDEALIPYESDEVTRLIIDSHDAAAFARTHDYPALAVSWLTDDPQGRAHRAPRHFFTRLGFRPPLTAARGPLLLRPVRRQWLSA